MKALDRRSTAREELRAEISAMMTGERVGVGHDPATGRGLCRELG